MSTNLFDLQRLFCDLPTFIFRLNNHLRHLNFHFRNLMNLQNKDSICYITYGYLVVFVYFFEAVGGGAIIGGGGAIGGGGGGGPPRPQTLTLDTFILLLPRPDSRAA